MTFLINSYFSHEFFFIIKMFKYQFLLVLNKKVVITHHITFDKLKKNVEKCLIMNWKK